MTQDPGHGTGFPASSADAPVGAGTPQTQACDPLLSDPLPSGKGSLYITLGARGNRSAISSPSVHAILLPQQSPLREGASETPKDQTTKESEQATLRPVGGQQNSAGREDAILAVESRCEPLSRSRVQDALMCCLNLQGASAMCLIMCLRRTYRSLSVESHPNRSNSGIGISILQGGMDLLLYVRSLG